MWDQQSQTRGVSRHVGQGSLAAEGTIDVGRLVTELVSLYDVVGPGWVAGRLLCTADAVPGDCCQSSTASGALIVGLHVLLSMDLGRAIKCCRWVCRWRSLGRLLSMLDMLWSLLALHLHVGDGKSVKGGRWEVKIYSNLLQGGSTRSYKRIRAAQQAAMLRAQTEAI